MNAKSVTRLIAAAVAGMGGWLLSPAPSQETHPIEFAKDIQPVFERSCISCHGPKLQMGGLRLDSKNVASKAILPGKAAESTLYQRVAGIGDQARMPMGGKPLPADELARIKAWIDQGANWPDTAAPELASGKKHWAYVPPQRAPLPAVKDAAWAKNGVDRFVLTRLEKEGLAPAPEADRVTLLRRLSLDLTGLPPTIEEVDAFLKDKSKRAYEKQVDRLLGSPHYGERWGRHWLDAARYADSDGYEKDKARQVWFYRDWVINALNRDLPYNQFIIDQLAGDLEPNATQDQRVATGFLRNSMINEEGGIDPEQFRMEAMFDRMEAVGKSVLGVTIQCAQCHNHKFDPLTQEEYYRIFAFLNDSHEGSIAVYTPEQQQKRAEIFGKMKAIEEDLQHRTVDWQERMASWEDKVKTNQPEWTVVTPQIDEISTGGQKYILQPDGSFLAQGYAPTKFSAKFSAKTDRRNITGFRLELLNDPNLPMNGPGRSIQGTCALTEFEVDTTPASELDNPKAKPVKVKIVKATADVSIPETGLNPIYSDKTDKKRVIGPIEYAIDGKEETAWGVDAGPGLRNQPRKAVFAAEKPIENKDGDTVIAFHLTQKHGGWNSDDNQNHNLGRIRLSITSHPNPEADPLPKNVREILSIPRSERTPAQTHAVFSFWRTTVPEWREANVQIAELWKQHPEPASQLVLQARQDPRKTSTLMRGDFLKPVKAVDPGVPSFLNPLPADAPQNRLSFAKWLVDRKAPTTARALVNRVWQTYFGTGFVSSSEDLGRQSETPSHPELLDWLAVELMDNNWSVKSLHREIVMSATYRQSSRVTPEMQARDPYNRLLARGPRFRVEAEVVRDIALAASGLLSPKVGGPSVFPPAPEFLFLPPASYGPKTWKISTGEDRYRRGVYTFRFRSVPYPMLQTFDAPNGDISCVRRSRSNTPLQALTTLNEPLFLETARALAMKTLREGGKTNAERMTYAVRRCIARKPTAEESAELMGLLDKQIARFSSGKANSWDLAAENPAAPPALPAGATAPELAAWTAVSRVLLNLDETITKE
jgi:hypothetical protein